MRRAVLVILAAAAVVAAVVLITGGASDDSRSSENAAARLQHRWVGARACMTASDRRRLKRIQKQSEARLDYLIRRLPPNAGDKEWGDAVVGDQRFVRLTQNATDLIRPYLPGQARHDRECYEGAWARFKRRAQRDESKPDARGAVAFTRNWASDRLREGESVGGVTCSVRTRRVPFRFRCTVRFHNRDGTQRAAELLLRQSIYVGGFGIVRTRPLSIAS